jgi:hypothetical protein
VTRTDLSHCSITKDYPEEFWLTVLSPFQAMNLYQLLAVIKNLNIACPFREYPTFVEDICTPNICHVPWQYAGFDNLIK